MVAPIPYDYRKLIVSKRLQGIPYHKIQEEIGYSISGIKKIWYQYQQEGESSYSTKYENCGRKSAYPQAVHDAIDSIRTGEQGASFVYSMLQLKFPHLPCPSIRTIQQWWANQQTNRPKGRPRDLEKKVGL